MSTFLLYQSENREYHLPPPTVFIQNLQAKIRKPFITYVLYVFFFGLFSFFKLFLFVWFLPDLTTIKYEKLQFFLFPKICISVQMTLLSVFAAVSNAQEDIENTPKHLTQSQFHNSILTDCNADLIVFQIL